MAKYKFFPLSCAQQVTEPLTPEASWLRSSPASLVDIDAPLRQDPQACTSYVCDIYRNLRVAECKRRPSSCYMEQVQRDINASMRGILVDWMVEVADEYKLVPETLNLAVSYMDRFLSVVPVLRGKLQLVGVASLLIASKYEEIYPQHLDEFCYIADNTYTKDELLQCERDILQVLNFELTVPTTRPFLRRFLRAGLADTKTEFLAMYLSEIALLDYGMLVFLPSQVAAAAVMLAQITLNTTIWSETLNYYSGYTKPELRNCVKALHKCFKALHKSRKSEMSSVREKYAMHNFKCVSTIAPNYSSLPDFLFH